MDGATHISSDLVDQAVILSCLRDVYRKIGFSTHQELAEAINKRDPSILLSSAKYYLQNKSISEEINSNIFPVALDIIIENFVEITTYYRQSKRDRLTSVTKRIAEFKRDDYKKLVKDGVIISFDNAAFIEGIIQNWQRPSFSGARHLKSGIYQMFRRYKTSDDETARQLASEDHPVIVEVLSVDSVRMECLLITADGNIYKGGLYINHEHTLTIFLQRTSQWGVHHRVIMLQLYERRLSIYSGMCMKIGDTTNRPVSADVIFRRIPKKDHESIYTEMRGIWSDPIDKMRSDEPSIIFDYISENPSNKSVDRNDPESAWARVTTVKDFPALQSLVVRDHPLLGEPLRTLGDHEITRVTREKGFSFPVFRQSERAAIPSSAK